jgi:arsenate reductase-like glutaredoxin family protein
MIVYGIPNCNTVKKARTWLSEQGIDYEFHDFKKQGITAGKLEEWCNVFGPCYFTASCRSADARKHQRYQTSCN